MNIKFGVFWKQNLGTIYKDNSITTLGKEADVDLNLSEVSSIHANFKVDGKNYTSIVYIVDIEKGLIRIPFTREVLSIGMHELELVAVMKNGDVIPSQTFTYNIVESLDNLEDITEETNYPILIQLLQDVNSKIAEIDDTIARIPSPEELKGEKGDKGDKGEQGIQGERGLQGIQGIRGEKGDKGDRGLQGIQGVKGEKGDKGERGERGLQGIQGNQGARGIQGEKGDKGETGVGLGFEWSGTKLGIKKDTDISYKYVELKGAKGEQGAKGEKGDTPSITHLEKQVSDKSKELDTKFNTLTAKQQQDAEVVTARDGEVSLHARLERDLAKGKIHFVDVEGSNIATESEEGYLKNVEIHGNTWQDSENLEDIRSVGTKVEGQELYKIDIVSCGKNLNNSIIELGGLITSSGLPTNNNVQFRSKDFISVIRNKSVYATINEPNLVISGFYSYDKNKNFISTAIQGAEPPENCKYLKVFGRHKVSGTDISSIISDNIKVQLEYGTQGTEYEPYQEDKLTILSPVQLEKVGGVADRIICKDGVYGVEKNIKSYLNLQRENWQKVDNSSSLHSIFVTDMLDVKKNTRVMSNLIPSNKNGAIYASCEEFSIGTHNSTSVIRVCIEKNKLMTDNVVGFMEWINSKGNQLNIKYVLDKPKFIPLPHDQQVKLRTFADRTNISFLTEIEPTLKAQVPKSLGATVNTHTSQIDNLNKELDRVKKLEESTVSTVTTDSLFTTVSETTQGYFEDVKIEGKTLVNLWEHTDNVFTQTTPNRQMTANSLNLLKPNTTYTCMLTLSNVDIDYHMGSIYAIRYNNNPTEYKVIPDGTTNGCKIFTFTTLAYDITGFHLGIHGNNSEGKQITFSNVIILEGDHTDKDITFFEGLKSVGQDTDEISVKSMSNGIVYENIPTKKGSYDSTTGAFDGKTNATAFDFLEVVSEATYRIITNKYTTLAHRVCFYDKDKKFIKSQLLNNVPSEFNVDDERIKYVTGHFATNNIYDTELKINICIKGSIKTNQADKKQILYYNPNTQTWEKPVLREWDSIEKHSDGKYYYHKRSGEVVLNDKMNVSIPSLNGEFLRYDIQLNANSSAGVICDKFIYDKKTLKEKITHINDSLLVIFIDKSKIASQDVDGFKSWLQANPTTVVYQLTQEEVYECTNLDLITYPNVTNLIVNSGVIQPKITLKVLSNVSNVVKLLQEKVSILENKFIRGLQQVLAGDMMSLAHLLYPEDFENNHEIQTLEL